MPARAGLSSCFDRRLSGGFRFDIRARSLLSSYTRARRLGGWSSVERSGCDPDEADKIAANNRSCKNMEVAGRAPPRVGSLDNRLFPRHGEVTCKASVERVIFLAGKRPAVVGCDSHSARARCHPAPGALGVISEARPGCSESEELPPTTRPRLRAPSPPSASRRGAPRRQTTGAPTLPTTRRQRKKGGAVGAIVHRRAAACVGGGPPQTPDAPPARRRRRRR